MGDATVPHATSALVDALRKAGIGLSTEDGNWTAECPAHRGPGLTLRPNGDKSDLACAAGCTADEILSAMQINPGRPGKPRKSAEVTNLFQYRRPNGNPDFAVAYPDGNSADKSAVSYLRPHGESTKGERRWVPGSKTPAGSRPLYRLPELLEADTQTEVLLLDDEPSAETALGLWPERVATTWAGFDWRQTDFRPLSERHVLAVLRPKAEELREDSRRTDMEELIESLRRLDADVRICIPFDMPPGGIAEWRAEGIEADRIYRHIDVLARPAKAMYPVFPRRNHRYLGAALGRLDIEIRKNMRIYDVQYRTSLNDEWLTLDEAKDAELRYEIADQFRFRGANDKSYRMKFPPAEWRGTMLAYVSARTIDPFKLWLLGLPEWDGVPRLDGLLARLFRIDQTNLVRWCSRYIALGVVQRTMEPGCELQEIAILQGKTGVGKTALLKNLMPSHGRHDWYTDDIKFNVPEIKRVEACIGRALCEIGEMQGMLRNYQANKPYISAENDGSKRMPYERRPAKMLRRYTFVGTTDRQDFFLPNDPEGNRRYVVTRLQRPDGPIEPYLDECRNQIWAEALHLYRSGVRANLPFQLRYEQEEAAEEARDQDVGIEEALQRADREGRIEGATMSEICRAIHMHRDLMRDQDVKDRVYGALRSIGFERVKTNPKNGERRHVFRRPDLGLQPAITSLHKRGRIAGATIDTVAQRMRLDRAEHYDGGSLKLNTRRKLNAGIRGLGYRREQPRQSNSRNRIYVRPTREPSKQS